MQENGCKDPSLTDVENAVAAWLAKRPQHDVDGDSEDQTNDMSGDDAALDTPVDGIDTDAADADVIDADGVISDN